MNRVFDSNPVISNQVKKSLYDFIIKNVPSADLSVIDDIVISYVVSIFEGITDDSLFDIDGFIELMSAYLPAFRTIEDVVVWDWALEVESDLAQQQMASENHKSKSMLEAFDVSGMLPPPAVKPERRAPESEEDNTEHMVTESEDDFLPQVQMLRDTFQNTCLMEIKHCITIAGGDIDMAASTLLYRREHGEALTGAALSAPRQVAYNDDGTVRVRVIERYSYMDDEDHKREHRPLAPKFEPKKMVRYRDSKVVSVKGEKYTEVSKNGEEENVKKPKKHCP